MSKIPPVYNLKLDWLALLSEGAFAGLEHLKHLYSAFSVCSRRMALVYAVEKVRTFLTKGLACRQCHRAPSIFVCHWHATYPVNPVRVEDQLVLWLGVIKYRHPSSTDNR
jgi:hypothetical protein